MREPITEAAAYTYDRLNMLGAVALGASLYVPATRPDLADILGHCRFPHLKSVIVCLEDAIYERDIPLALSNLERALDQHLPSGLLRFLRPRDSGLLKRLLRMSNIEAINGLVLPKVNEFSIGHFAEIAALHPNLWLMPTLESDIAFDRGRLLALCKRLQEPVNPVLCVRTGGNDLLRLLGLHRARGVTLYETPMRGVLEDLIKVFKPAGFEMAAPVFGYLDDLDVLTREAALDVAYGFASKAALSPSQLSIIEQAYQVDRQDYESAQALLEPRAPAVFKLHGQMLEVAVHQDWARRIVARAELFGIQARESRSS